MQTVDHAVLASFISSTTWGQQLSVKELDAVLSASYAKHLAKGEFLVTSGQPARFWVGIIQGFVVHSTSYADGTTTFMAAVTDGQWFGEGTLLKQEPWMFDAIALRDTVVAFIPRPQFDALHRTSIPFNHFLQHSLNDRLSFFIRLAESERRYNALGRVARTIANLVSPALHSPSGEMLRITQTELALLAGMSRQHINGALKKLREAGIVRTGHSGIEICDLERLLLSVST